MSYSLAVEEKYHAIASGVRIQHTDRDVHGEPRTKETTIRGRATLETLARAESYWMSENIWRAITESSKSLPLDFALSDKLPPSDYGWMWFERGWEIPESAPMIYRQHQENCVTPAALAVSWGMGVSVTGQATLVVETFHRATDGLLIPLFYTYMPNGRTVQEEQDRRREELRRLGRQDDFHALDAIMRAVLAAFLWMSQTICVSQTMPLERHARKRLASIAIEKALHVVTLRRTERPGDALSGESRDVEWSCQWIVRGHWRNQYHPSTGRHEPRFILPYVKGPDDRPLKPPTERIFAVTR